MPLISITHDESGTLGIWDLTGTLQDLSENFCFSEEEISEFNRISSEKRKKEYLAVRILLETMLGRKHTINYHKSGKPFVLDSPLHISISHSADLAVILLSERENGVDAELAERNTEKIASRFLSSEELDFSASTIDPAKTRILLWSAKEAIFKCAGTEGTDFARQIRIEPFEPASVSRFRGYLFSENKIRHFILKHTMEKTNVIVVCWEEKEDLPT